MKFTVFAAFLFSIGWMSVVVAGVGPTLSCCLTVSDTKIKAENIVDYTIQDPFLCPITAVRFHTKENKVICSSPDSVWAKRVMKIVDDRKTKPFTKPTRCYTSTTNVIPTTATTDKTSATKTETSMSTTVTPAVTTIRTFETKTSTSRTVPTTVTTVKTSRPDTTTSKITTLQPLVSKEKPESTAITCGTDEPAVPPTETTTATTSVAATATARVTKTTKKLSKMMIRKKGKSKKLLRKIQIGKPLKNTTTRPNKT